MLLLLQGDFFLYFIQCLLDIIQDILYILDAH